MTAALPDHFAVLGEPRRPWGEAEALKEKFLRRTGEVHPDRVHESAPEERRRAGELSAAVNAAYNLLREPKERLRHLIELETGARPAEVQTVPPGLTETAFAIGRLCRTADGLAQENERATSPLVQVGVFQRAQPVLEELTTLRAGLVVRRAELLAEIQALDAAWDAAPTVGDPSPPRPWERLAEIERLLGYFQRWLRQLDDRVVRLSF